MSKTLEQLEEELLKIDDNIKDIDQRMEPLKKKRAKNYKARELIKDNILELRKDDISYVLFDANAFEQLRAMLPEGLQTHGYYPLNDNHDTPEQGIRVSIAAKDEISEEMIEFIENKWLPISKLKRLDIDYHEGHSDFHLAFNEDKWSIESYYVNSFARCQGSLKEVLEHVADNYPNVEPDYNSDLGMR